MWRIFYSKYNHFIFLFLVVSFAANVVLASYLIYEYKAIHQAVEHDSPYPLVDISRDFIEQKDFIVNLQPLKKHLDQEYKKYGEENISTYIEFLNTGASISHNPDAKYYPASLIKMPIAIATAKKVEKGDWSWDSELVLFAEDVDSGYGKISGRPIGTRFRIEALLSELIIHSDNTAYKMLLRNLGGGEVNEYLENAGLQDLFDQELNITSLVIHIKLFEQEKLTKNIGNIDSD